MGKRHAWEFRVNGIRASGDTFRNYDDAIERMFSALSGLHFVSPGDRDHNGPKESELIAVAARVKRERPYVDLTVKAMRQGKPWVLQVNRLPWAAMVADTPEIESVLWLSTAHLTWDTVERIEACGQDGAWRCFPLNYGFLAYVYPADRKPDDIPGDLWRCLDYARRHGCAYIRFDADGPIMGALPDWSYTHR